jgi:hypothetical protein
MASQLPELVVTDAATWRTWRVARHDDADALRPVPAERGFTEPTRSVYAEARRVGRSETASEEAITDNRRFFADGGPVVPCQVLTRGIGTILEARHLVNTASGPPRRLPSLIRWSAPRWHGTGLGAPTRPSHHRGSR